MNLNPQLMMILVTLTTLMKVNQVMCPLMNRIDYFSFFQCREDEKALLLAELERVKKEKELAKQKEVRNGFVFLLIGRRESTNASCFE